MTEYNCSILQTHRWVAAAKCLWGSVYSSRYNRYITHATTRGRRTRTRLGRAPGAGSSWSYRSLSAHAVQLVAGCPGAALGISGTAISRWLSAHPPPMLRACTSYNPQNNPVLTVKTAQCRHLRRSRRCSRRASPFPCLRGRTSPGRRCTCSRAASRERRSAGFR